MDESLAVHAVFEGDATVASVVLDLTRQGETSAEAIARIDRRYIVACPMKKRSRRTATIEAAIDVAFAELCIAPQDR